MLCAVLVLLAPFVTSHDVAIGLNSYGTKIFDENRQASPAIWRQNDNVTIVAPDNEVISKVLVIDMRPEKDGDAKIVDGGVNQKNVTIELKSPTVLRGYDFHIEVYTVPEDRSDQADTEQHASTSINSITIKDGSSSTQSPSITEMSPSEQSTMESTSTDTIRNARNSDMDNNNESNNTLIKNKADDSGNETGTGDENTSYSTTSSDIISTAFPETTGQNIPDFLITGMGGEEKRHIRKIGDDLYTSTTNVLTTIIQNDGTTESYSSDDKTIPASENGSDENNATFDLGVKVETDATTVSDIVTTTIIDESATISPDKNGKDIPDFDDLLSTDGEESRFARQISAEMVSTTNSEFSSTEDGSPTTTSPNILTDFNSENRNQREAVYDTINYTTVTTGEPLEYMVGDQIPPLLVHNVIIEHGANNTNIQTNKRNEGESQVKESSGDFNSTENVGDVTIIPDILSTDVSFTDTNENTTEDQFRTVRDIKEENDTLNPETNEEKTPTVDEDYVYIPILAVISKHNYPVFRGVLDNIAMNVASPVSGANTVSDITQDSNELANAESNPIFVT